MANASVEIAESLDIYCRKDDTFNLVLTVQNSDSSAFDFTSYSATLDVKKSANSSTNVLSFSNGAGLTLSSGSIALSKSAAAMDLESGAYFYELNITDASSNVNAWLTGAFVINSDKTNDITSSSTLTVNTSGSAVTITVNVGATSGVGAAGSDTEIQYNNGGVLGGATSLTYNDATGVTSSSANVSLGAGADLVLSSTSALNDGTSDIITHDGSGNVTIPNGDLTVSSDTDATTILGRARIDSRTTNAVYLSHFDNSGANDFALYQSQAGATIINSKAANSLSFKIGNVSKWSLDINGNLTAVAGIDLNLTNTSAIQVDSIDAITFDASQNVTIPNGDLTVHNWTVGLNSIEASLSLGPSVRHEGSSSTNPTIVPNKSSVSTGLGGSAGQVSLINVSIESLTTDASNNVTIPNGVLYTNTYTVATLPTATTAAGLIFVSDETGGAIHAFSDGTNWRRMSDRAVVS